MKGAARSGSANDVDFESDRHRDDYWLTAPTPARDPAQHPDHHDTVTFTTLGTSTFTSGAAIVNSAETAGAPNWLPDASTA